VRIAVEHELHLAFNHIDQEAPMPTFEDRAAVEGQRDP